MKTKTPTVNTQPRFFLQLLIAAALMAVIAPITAVADNLYVSANQDGSIFEYTPAGIQSTFVSYPAKLPRGLAFDSNGNLFAAVSNFSTTLKPQVLILQKQKGILEFGQMLNPVIWLRPTL